MSWKMKDHCSALSALSLTTLHQKSQTVGETRPIAARSIISYQTWWVSGQRRNQPTTESGVRASQQPGPDPAQPNPAGTRSNQIQTQVWVGLIWKVKLHGSHDHTELCCVQVLLTPKPQRRCGVRSTFTDHLTVAFKGLGESQEDESANPAAEEEKAMKNTEFESTRSVTVTSVQHLVKNTTVSLLDSVSGFKC